MTYEYVMKNLCLCEYTKYEVFKMTESIKDDERNEAIKKEINL